MEKKYENIYEYVNVELKKTVELVDITLQDEIPELMSAKAKLLDVRRSALEGLIKMEKLKFEVEKIKKDIDMDNKEIVVKIEKIGE